MSRTPETDIAYVAACAVGMAYSDRCANGRLTCVEELAHLAGCSTVIDEARARVAGLHVAGPETRRRADALLAEARAHLSVEDDRTVVAGAHPGDEAPTRELTG